MVNLKVEKAYGDYDYGTSKFFGAPTMPEEWLSDGTLNDDDFFFCQIKLSELRSNSDCTLLPEKGFLYFFLSKEDDEHYTPNIKLCNEEPETLVDDFNLGFDFITEPDEEYSIDFSNDNPSAETALFIDEGDCFTLLRYDPLDDNMPDFLANTEKQAFFTITKADLESLNFSDVAFQLK